MLIERMSSMYVVVSHRHVYASDSLQVHLYAIPHAAASRVKRDFKVVCFVDSIVGNPCNPHAVAGDGEDLL